MFDFIVFIKIQAFYWVLLCVIIQIKLDSVLCLTFTPGLPLLESSQEVQ